LDYFIVSEGVAMKREPGKITYCGVLYTPGWFFGVSARDGIALAGCGEGSLVEVLDPHAHYIRSALSL
jgi:hypothetical protein